MQANIILNEVQRHANKNTRCHALYDYYFLKLNRSQLAKIYRKSFPTISDWIQKFEKNSIVGRKKDIAIVYRKFGHEKRQWLVDLFKEMPILYLNEAQVKFLKKFGHSISASSVSLILHEAGLSWKVIERRAIQIKLKDVLRFCNEMSMISWSWESLVFLDEVSFNGRDMIRKHGYGARGQPLVYRGEFNRTARTSLLVFIGVNGLMESFETSGTFTRKKFVHYCRQFALENNDVRAYPGQCSVWLLDGAKIHCSDKLVYYLRSLGILPIFLPAYTPMLNPIEYVFGMIKATLKKHYRENSNTDKNILLCEIINTFTKMYMGPLFQHCGYHSSGRFDPSEVLKLDFTKINSQ